ncbi:MAG: DUF4115 domain-containing protein [Chloroflexi bacterium]|nr:DUF4115 domain-containing protein [Chloroflexota bacterium]
MTDAEVLGQRLREARESRELTLEEAARKTRIRARFLDAIERGDYADMSPVQAQGFLRNYARALGLDFELLLSELEAARNRGGLRRLWGRKPPPARSIRTTQTLERVIPQAPPAAPPEQKSKTRRERKKRGLFGNLVIVIVAGVIVIGLVFGLTWLFDTLASDDDSPDDDIQTELTGESTASPEMDGPADDPGDEPRALTPPAETAETPSPPAADMAGPTPGTNITPPPLVLEGESIEVLIRVEQRTWLQVTVDGAVQPDSMVAPGDEPLIYVGQQSVRVRASNAAALNLIINGQALGVVGTRGQLYDETFALPGAEPPLSIDPNADPAMLSLANYTANRPPLVVDGDSVQLLITVNERTWLEITVDGIVQMDDIAEPGAQMMQGEQYITLRTSSAGALELTTNNNQRLENLGPRGQFYAQTFALPGVDIEPPGESMAFQPSGEDPAMTPASPDPAALSLTPAAGATAAEGVSMKMLQTDAAPGVDSGVNPATTSATSAPSMLVPSPSLTSAPPPTITPTLAISLTPTPTLSLAPSSTPTIPLPPSWTPTPSNTPPPSATATSTPFLPPRQTRTPSPTK